MLSGVIKMNGKVVVEIDKKDRDRMSELYQKLTSMKSLLGIWHNDDLIEINEKNWFQKRLSKDLKKSDKEYNNLWSYIVSKYNLDKKNIERYYLDFEECMIYLTD
ncbi:CXXX repeat peptide modification system protein [Clostridium botulinum]|uniref:CXXX repeat peptide modification system protein n=2 Tax=Clostridium botulinum TaxID=1491 RepID=UPI001969BA08|nr:CXXX repeat peptide modification system protein [Clostridium botulinum]MBY6873988.1 CXXX repeat peptide modification system protein [Clostridium botulinum]